MLKRNYSNLIEAGIDEAGRGCLMGPVFAAAVILPTHFFHPLLNDSKRVNVRDRHILKKIIIHHAIAYSIASIDNGEIDNINILQATMKAMHLCIKNLKIQPEFLIIDGNYFIPYQFIPYKCMIKGDAQFMSIAAASILAKTFRDDFVNMLHNKLPHYGWNTNKGYGTKKHIEAIKKFGLSPYHRLSYKIF